MGTSKNYRPHEWSFRKTAGIAAAGVIVMALILSEIMSVPFWVPLMPLISLAVLLAITIFVIVDGPHPRRYLPAHSDTHNERERPFGVVWRWTSETEPYPAPYCPNCDDPLAMRKAQRRHTPDESVDFHCDTCGHAVVTVFGTTVQQIRDEVVRRLGRAINPGPDNSSES